MIMCRKIGKARAAVVLRVGITVAIESGREYRGGETEVGVIRPFLWVGNAIGRERDIEDDVEFRFRFECFRQNIRRSGNQDGSRRLQVE